MPREFFRTDRVADAIKRLLATLILQEVNDPRIGMVNINEVSVTKDLALAKVYVTFVGCENEGQCEQASRALNNAAGYLRKLLAKETDLRTTPKLQFFYDKTPVRGQVLSGLIERALAEDLSRSKDA